MHDEPPGARRGGAGRAGRRAGTPSGRGEPGAEGRDVQRARACARGSRRAARSGAASGPLRAEGVDEARPERVRASRCRPSGTSGSAGSGGSGPGRTSTAMSDAARDPEGVVGGRQAEPQRGCARRACGRRCGCAARAPARRSGGGAAALDLQRAGACGSRCPQPPQPVAAGQPGERLPGRGSRWRPRGGRSPRPSARARAGARSRRSAATCASMSP